MSKICKKCLLTKDLSEFSTAGSYKGQKYFRPECKECVRIYMRTKGQAAQIKYRNSEKGKIQKQAHKKTQKYRDQQRKYELKRMHEDELFKLLKYLRSRTNKAIKSKNFTKTCKFKEYIGCSSPELKNYLESKFQLDMSWDNYGQWHIDHPLSSASTPEEMYKLCHYTNLQPLWASDNLAKSDKCTPLT